MALGVYGRGQVFHAPYAGGGSTVATSSTQKNSLSDEYKPQILSPAQGGIFVPAVQITIPAGLSIPTFTEPGTTTVVTLPSGSYNIKLYYIFDLAPDSTPDNSKIYLVVENNGTEYLIQNDIPSAGGAGTPIIDLTYSETATDNKVLLHSDGTTLACGSYNPGGIVTLYSGTAVASAGSTLPPPKVEPVITPAPVDVTATVIDIPELPAVSNTYAAVNVADNYKTYYLNADGQLEEITDGEVNFTTPQRLSVLRSVTAGDLIYVEIFKSVGDHRSVFIPIKAANKDTRLLSGTPVTEITVDRKTVEVYKLSSDRQLELLAETDMPKLSAKLAVTTATQTDDIGVAQPCYQYKVDGNQYYILQSDPALRSFTRPEPTFITVADWDKLLLVDPVSSNRIEKPTGVALDSKTQVMILANNNPYFYTIAINGIPDQTFNVFIWDPAFQLASGNKPDFPKTLALQADIAGLALSTQVGSGYTQLSLYDPPVTFIEISAKCPVYAEDGTVISKDKINSANDKYFAVAPEIIEQTIADRSVRCYSITLDDDTIGYVPVDSGKLISATLFGARPIVETKEVKIAEGALTVTVPNGKEIIIDIPKAVKVPVIGKDDTSYNIKLEFEEIYIACTSREKWEHFAKKGDDVKVKVYLQRKDHSYVEFELTVAQIKTLVNLEENEPISISIGDKKLKNAFIISGQIDFTVLSTYVTAMDPVLTYPSAVIPGGNMDVRDLRAHGLTVRESAPVEIEVDEKPIICITIDNPVTEEADWYLPVSQIETYTRAFQPVTKGALIVSMVAPAGLEPYRDIAVPDSDIKMPRFEWAYAEGNGTYNIAITWSEELESYLEDTYGYTWEDLSALSEDELRALLGDSLQTGELSTDVKWSYLVNSQSYSLPQIKSFTTGVQEGETNIPITDPAEIDRPADIPENLSPQYVTHQLREIHGEFDLGYDKQFNIGKHGFWALGGDLKGYVSHRTPLVDSANQAFNDPSLQEDDPYALIYAGNVGLHLDAGTSKKTLLSSLRFEYGNTSILDQIGLGADISGNHSFGKFYSSIGLHGKYQFNTYHGTDYTQITNGSFSAQAQDQLVESYENGSITYDIAADAAEPLHDESSNSVTGNNDFVLSADGLFQFEKVGLPWDVTYEHNNPILGSSLLTVDGVLIVKPGVWEFDLGAQYGLADTAGYSFITGQLGLGLRPSSKFSLTLQSNIYKTLSVSDTPGIDLRLSSELQIGSLRLNPFIAASNTGRVDGLWTNPDINNRSWAGLAGITVPLWGRHLTPSLRGATTNGSSVISSVGATGEAKTGGFSVNGKVNMDSGAYGRDNSVNNVYKPEDINNKK